MTAGMGRREAAGERPCAKGQGPDLASGPSASTRISCCRSALTAAAGSATTTTTARATRPATPTAAIGVVGRRTTPAGRLTSRNRRALNAIEVWLGLLLEAPARLPLGVVSVWQ